MRFIIKPFIGVLGLALAAPLSFVAASGGVVAQEQDAGPAEGTKQIPLTAQQIENFIAAQKTVAPIMAKLPEGEEKPNPKVIAQLDSAVKKYNFANYDQYDLIASNIGLVMAGIDPQTKKYVGAGVMVKKQIAEVQADKQMSPKDKKQQIADLNAQLGATEAAKIPANIALIEKYYDKLNAAMPQDPKDQ